MLKAVMVGMGGISGAHYPTWQNIEGVDFAAVCDLIPERTEKCPEQRHYTDYEKMLDEEKPDIVDICVPTPLHVELSLKAIERGINVICEKPISLHREDVERVYDAAREHGVKYMIAQVLRFFPEYDFVKQIYDSGIYGKLVCGNMQRVGQFPYDTTKKWFCDPEQSGLVPFDLHIHDLDFLVYAFGEPKSFVKRRANLPGNQDNLHIIYDYDDFFINCEATWAVNHDFFMRFRFHFERAVVEMDSDGFVVREIGGRVIDPAKEKIDGLSFTPCSGYDAEIRYFVNCVQNDLPCDKVKKEQLACVLDIIGQ